MEPVQIGVGRARAQVAASGNCLDCSEPMDRIQKRRLDRRDRIDLYCNCGHFLIRQTRTASLTWKIPF
jgi:hypothetical protein